MSDNKTKFLLKTEGALRTGNGSAIPVIPEIGELHTGWNVVSFRVPRTGQRMTMSVFLTRVFNNNNAQIGALVMPK